LQKRELMAYVRKLFDVGDAAFFDLRNCNRPLA
jgi:hypothetical protein